MQIVILITFEERVQLNFTDIKPSDHDNFSNTLTFSKKGSVLILSLKFICYYAQPPLPTKVFLYMFSIGCKIFCSLEDPLNYPQAPSVT